MPKQKFASDRKQQQAKALSFKAEKQAQGKFGGAAGLEETKAARSFDTPQENFQLKRQAQITAGLIQPAAQALTSIQQPIAERAEPNLIQQPITAGQDRGDFVSRNIGKLTEFLGLPVNKNAAGETIGPTKEGALEIGKALGLTALGFGGAIAGAEAGLGPASAAGRPALKTFENLVKARKLGLLPTGTKIGGQMRDLTPEILRKLAQHENAGVIYKTSEAAKRGINFVINQKSRVLAAEILGGFGTAGSIFWRYINEKKTDIPFSTITSLDSEANNARTLQLYDEADRLEEIKLEALQANKELDNLNAWEVITGKRSQMANKARFEAEEAISGRRIEITRRLRESSTPKQYFERIEKDKKQDLEGVDAELKGLQEQIQTSIDIARREKLDVSFYLKKQGEIDKLKAQKKEDIINYYDTLVRDFYELQADKLKNDHEQLIKAYTPL